MASMRSPWRPRAITIRSSARPASSASRTAWIPVRRFTVKRRLAFQGGDGMGGNRFAAADFADAFVGFRFEVHLRGLDAQGLGDGLAHPREVGVEFWLLRHDDGVHVSNAQASFAQLFRDVLEEN